MASRRCTAMIGSQAPRGWSTGVVEGRKDDREQGAGVSVPPTPSNPRSKKESDILLFSSDNRRRPAVVGVGEEAKERGEVLG